MRCDSDNNYHCLLIYDEEQGDGMLIESEGAAYARYSQYVPNAKLLYEDHIRTLSQTQKQESTEQIAAEEIEEEIQMDISM